MLLNIENAEAPSMPEVLVTEVEMEVTQDQLSRLDLVERSAANRASIYNEGYDAGFLAAADDYCNGKVDLELFDKIRGERDIADFYATGFETGYFRKLAELLMF